MTLHELDQKVFDFLLLRMVCDAFVGKHLRAPGRVDADDDRLSFKKISVCPQTQNDESYAPQRETENGNLEVGVHSLKRAVELQELAPSGLDVFGDWGRQRHNCHQSS